MKRLICAGMTALFALAGYSAVPAQRTVTTKTTTTTRITTTRTTTMTKPAVVEDRDTLELVFVLDTTGSMGGLIDGAKQRIWGIINEVMQKPSKPRVRVGLVAYRDNGDEYITKLLPLTEDLDKAYTTLMDYQANGGGDTPENVRKALAEGVRNAGWSKAGLGMAQIVFLVGDAPPQNYEQEPDVLVTTAEAVRKNMIVNTIQCGNLDGTRQIWQSIALRGEGKYFAIAQDGGVQAITTPFDPKLAELATKLGKTYVSYGEKKKREVLAMSQSAAESRITSDAALGAQADRAVNKAVNSFQYDGDLVQDVENEAVRVKDIRTDQLPEEMQKLSVPEREKLITERIAQRKKIRIEIVEISKQRDAYIAAERKKLGRSNGFDTAVAAALREQLLKKGIK
jgi:Mg-chelatase subunit ChlD